MIDIGQFKEHIIIPTLTKMGMMSESAVNLLLGTALVESGLKYIKQIGGGPALGVYQIEPATLHDLYKNYLVRKPKNERFLNEIVNWRTSEWRTSYDGKFTSIRGADTPTDEIWEYLESSLIGNLFYGTAIARLIYRRRPEPLPEADDVHAMAHYWKSWYNTEAGRGTPDDYERMWEHKDDPIPLTLEPIGR